MDSSNIQSSHSSSTTFLFEEGHRSAKRSLKHIMDPTTISRNPLLDHEGNTGGPSTRHTKWLPCCHHPDGADTHHPAVQADNNLPKGSRHSYTDTDPVDKVTLPPFRELFAFALRDTSEPQARHEHGALQPARYSSFKGSSLPCSGNYTTERRFTFAARMHSSPSTMSDIQTSLSQTLTDPDYDYPPKNSHNGREFDSQSSSSESSGESDTDYIWPTSSSHTATPSPLNRPARIPSPKHYLSSNAPHNLPTMEHLFISSAPPATIVGSGLDDHHVAKRARTVTPINANITEVAPWSASTQPNVSFTSSVNMPPPTLTAPYMSRTSPSQNIRTTFRRARPSQPRQEWENYAMELESPHCFYRCLWDDGVHCEYIAKKQAMKRHVELTHLKYKPHKCHICDKSYGQRTSLDVHLATHTGDKDHVCPEEDCPRAYGDASRLLRHRVRVHGYIVRPTAPKLRYGIARYPGTVTKSIKKRSQ